MEPNRRDIVLGAAALFAGCGPAGRAVAQAAAPAGTLSNPDASPNARAVYRYLWSIYGNNTLAGQQESDWTAGGPTAELDFIRRTSGRLPAILGLDYIEPRTQRAVNERATRWYEQGGIPTICWHWGAPDTGTGYENSKKDFDLARAFQPGTTQYKAMNRDLAHIGDLLTVLRDRGVPVLWRPLHEFSGSWFWWGRHGPQGFVALWRAMYDYLTHQRGLNNLIWVLGYAGSEIDPVYYPGRAYVDIAGADTYVDDHGNLAPMFAAVKAIVGDTVPICLHENGPIPDPATSGPGSAWLYFMTWHTDFILGSKTNTVAEIKAFYNSDRYITRDEIPPGALRG